MPTEAQIEAAHAVLRERKCFVPWEDLAAALDAADRAAWSTDMEAAPPLERVLVSGIEKFVSGISHNERSYRWWEEGAADVNGRMIDHPTADMWRPLPIPPETTDD